MLIQWQRLLLREIPRAPDGAGGGGSGGGDGGGGGGAAADPLAAAVPQGFFDKYALPDGMKGQTFGETFDKLFTGWKGGRDEIAKRGAPPKEAKAYQFQPAEPIKGYFKNQDDPWLGIAKEAAFKTGMEDQKFGPFLNELFSMATEKKLMPALYEPNAQIAALGETMFKDIADPKERDTKISGAIQGAVAFAPVLADQLKLSPAAKAELIGMGDYAGGVELLHSIKALLTEKGIEVGGAPQNQGYDQAAYDRDVADPRYAPFSPKFDKAFREGVDAKAKKLFGTGAPQQ